MVAKRRGNSNSNLRQREEMLARRVGEALDQLDSRGARECPDAEMIAAYAEQALGPAELEEWEGHFATCSRCRKILRVLAASAETPLAQSEITRLGELVSAARASATFKNDSPASSGRAWLQKWRIRWLAPAVGVAAVFAVLFALRGPWRTANRAETTLVAQAPKEKPPSASPLAREPVETLRKQAKKADEQSTENSRSAMAQQYESRTRDGANPETAPPPAKAKAPEAPPALPSPGATPSAATPALQANNAVTAQDRLSEDKNLPEPQRAAGAVSPPKLSPRVTINAERSASITAFKTAGAGPVIATSPFGSTVWRAGSGGRIEYSADAGESWTAQASPVQEDWLAGVAVSDTACWLAGRNGAIARTTDGEHWERIAPPKLAAAADGKMPDWTAISSRGVQSAVVTAANGRRFVTTDGGASWQSQ